MAYTKTAWVDGQAPAISAANLNKLETQYDEAISTAASDATTKASSARSDAASDVQAIKLGTGTFLASASAQGDFSSPISDRLESKFYSFLGAGKRHILRNSPGAFTQGVDDFSTVEQTGLTGTSAGIGATVAGTDGTAVFPFYGANRNFRTSYRVAITKATTGSRTISGWYTLAPGAIPSSTNFAFGVGYLQGTGLAIIRENVGSSIVLIPDANLTDGTEVDVTMWVDTTLGATAGSLTGIAYAHAYSAGSGALLASTSTSFSFVNFPVNNNLIRTNVAGTPFKNLVVSQSGNGPMSVGPNRGEVGYQPGEAAYIWLPRKSNGRLVIAMHGHGSSPTDTGTSSNFLPTWQALSNAGYTVAVPRLGGDLWGNSAVQTYIGQLYSQMINDYSLDPGVHLWGNSMGGGAALTAIFRQTVPVRSAYLAEPASNLEWVAGTGSYPTLASAYASAAERDQYDPQKQPASAFLGVPMLFSASASDTAIVKTQNTDLMRTKLGSSAPNYLITATGAHNSASHFRANDTLNFFRLNG